MWFHGNPHQTRGINFGRRFSVNVWCDLLGNKLIGQFVLDNNLTGNTYEFFLRNDLPGLLGNISVMVKGQIYFQRDWARPHYIQHVKEYLHESSPNHWLGHSGPLALLSLVLHEGISV
jgi:hypothetical protein